MDQQTLIFESSYLARNSDPITSHAAAHEHVANGNQECHLKIIVEAIGKHPGSTSAELAEITGLERHEAARRTSDARRKGMAEQGESRPCRMSGKQSITWWPADMRQARAA